MRGRHGIASHGMARRPRVGIGRPIIRKNVSAEMAVDASMPPALLRPRITLSSVNEPERTGAAKISLSEGKPEKSSSVGVVGRDADQETSAITGQSTP